MADHALVEDQPRRSSSSSERKRPCGDVERPGHKKTKGTLPSSHSSSQHDLPAGDLPSLGGEVNNEPGPPTGGDFGRLTVLLSDLVNKLDSGAQVSAPPLGGSDFSGFHDLSGSEECASPESERDQLISPDLAPDPLDDLDGISSAQPAPSAEDDLDFLRALDDLAGCFTGEESKGEAVSERLASIVNTSLRRRPNTENVKAACSRLLVPSNVPNMKVPETNPAISRALSVGGKLLDARLAHTNALLLKALVPIIRCISDIGEKTGKSISSYLGGFNDSLRLVVSAFNYLNHLRKEVARIHVHDTALTDLCKWDYEVGKDALFPFDVAKKCDEIHKMKRLGRPSFRPYKFGRPQGYDARQGAKRPYFSRAKPSSSSRPFLGQRQSRGRRTHNYKHPQ